MQSVGALEAQTHLAEILDRVEQVESLTITRGGKPIAQLVPLVSAEPHSRLDAIRELRVFRKGRRLNGLSIRDLIDEGRRI